MVFNSFLPLRTREKKKNLRKLIDLFKKRKKTSHKTFNVKCPRYNSKVSTTDLIEISIFFKQLANIHIGKY